MSYQPTSKSEPKAQVKKLSQEVQEATANSIEVAFVDQVYTGEKPEEDAKTADIELIAVKIPETKKGFILLPRCCERSFGWMTLNS